MGEAGTGGFAGSGTDRSRLLPDRRRRHLDIGQGFFVDLGFGDAGFTLTDLFFAGEEKAWLDGAAREATVSGRTGLVSK